METTKWKVNTQDCQKKHDIALKLVKSLKMIKYRPNLKIMINGTKKNAQRWQKLVYRKIKNLYLKTIDYKCEVCISG